LAKVAAAKRMVVAVESLMVGWLGWCGVVLRGW
jgi:hypothetical protein